MYYNIMNLSYFHIDSKRKSFQKYFIILKKTHTDYTFSDKGTSIILQTHYKRY